MPGTAPGRRDDLGGEAGFYHAYAGNNLRVAYSFTAKPRRLGKITEGLAATGSSRDAVRSIRRRYNIAHIDVSAAVRGAHLKYADIDHIERGELARNRIPEPAFPSRGIDIRRAPAAPNTSPPMAR